MSMLDELYTYIPAHTSLTSGLLHLGILPESPDRAIALYEYSGGAGFSVQESPGTAYEDLRLQVVCRGVPHDYTGPRADAMILLNSLMVIQSQTLSGIWWVSVDALQSPFMMERDVQSRVKIGNNYRVVKRIS